MSNKKQPTQPTKSPSQPVRRPANDTPDNRPTTRPPPSKNNNTNRVTTHPLSSDIHKNA